VTSGTLLSILRRADVGSPRTLEGRVVVVDIVRESQPAPGPNLEACL
jgi:hypothetical protein